MEETTGSALDLWAEESADNVAADCCKGTASSLSSPVLCAGTASSECP
ncbi:hypothetical protein SAMN04489733_3630 [Amycolatopsis keratiniphila]|nr:hypothetical protein SAMN04489733_3630 [Amycolatopsis keratiniphila]